MYVIVHSQKKTSVEDMTTPATDLKSIGSTTESSRQTYQLWGGRFGSKQESNSNDAAASSSRTGPPTSTSSKTNFDLLNSSLPIDIELQQVDIQGSIAYARSLVRCGAINEDEFRTIETGFEKILNLYCTRQSAATDDCSTKLLLDEDVHTLNERLLVEEIGSEIGGKIHTGRSRNEQVALDTKLWLLDACTILLQLFSNHLLTTCANRAQEFLAKRTIIPGFTHSQPAQPVLLAHWLLSHAWPFARDARRLNRLMEDIRSACPLGSGAIAGSPLQQLDRMQLALDLGFTGVTQNSMDATSDRDFIVEFHMFASLFTLHISRLAEDLILYTGPQYKFLNLADTFCTGSSLMPQKRNPDALELLRCKPAQFCGRLMDVLMLMKALPSCYNKDLQEDKQNLFASVKQLKIIIPVLTDIIGTLTVNADNCRKHLTADMLATDLAYFLVRNEGIAFRTAHHTAGLVVQYAEQRGVPLEQLSAEEIIEAADGGGRGQLFGRLDKATRNEKLEKLFKDFSGSVEQYDCVGGTASVAVEQQLRAFDAEIQQLQCKNNYSRVENASAVIPPRVKVASANTEVTH